MLANLAMTAEYYNDPDMDLIQLQSDSTPKETRPKRGMIRYKGRMEQHTRSQQG